MWEHPDETGFNEPLNSDKLSLSVEEISPYPLEESSLLPAEIAFTNPVVSASPFPVLLTFPGLCHNLVFRDVNHLFLQKDIILVHCIGDIMLIRPCEWRVATTQDLLVKKKIVCPESRKINPAKVQGLSNCEFSRDSRWCETCWDILSKVKNNLSYLALPITKKEAQYLVDFEIWYIFLIWVCYSRPFAKLPEMLLVLNGTQNKRKLCSSSRLPCKLLCCLSHMIEPIQ